MDLILSRKDFRPDGIFSELRMGDGSLVAITLEHAYPDRRYGWEPKIPDGTYQCVRGMHQLEGMIAPFETFEITNVIGHTDILFHVGNVNSDSAGCVLLGMGLGVINKMQAVTSSKMAFLKFMDLQTGVDQFTLVVSSS
jgi:hypothetical protein